MKKITKTLSLILALCMLLSSYTIAFAAEPEEEIKYCGPDATWTFDERTETLTISGTGTTYNYSLPKDIPWYEHGEKITNVVIEEGITKIGNGICYFGTNITIPKSVYNIEHGAFYSVKYITVPKDSYYYTSINGVLYNKNMTWLLCFVPTKYSEFIIPDSVTHIGHHVFSGANVNTLVIPDNVTYIGQSAFANANITTINIGNGVKDFAYDAFYDFSYLTKSKVISINISEDNPYFDSIEGVVFNKDATELVHFPSIRTGSYIIPNTVTKINAYAFNASSLTNVTIPDSVTKIGSNAFTHADIVSINIPSSVQEIGFHAFSSCKNLKNVIISNGVETIKEYAFRYCDNLTNVVMESGNYECGAFEYCTSLTNVTIGKNVTVLGSETFYGCTALKEIVIPENINYIESYTFLGCTNLEKIVLQNKNIGIEDSQTSIPKNVIIYGHCSANDTVFDGNYLTPYKYAKSYFNKFRSVSHIYNDNEEICSVCKNEPVNEVLVNHISIDNLDITLYTSEIMNLNAKVKPANAYIQTLTYTSTNTDVVVVDENGTITAIKPGTARVNITANDGSNTSTSVFVTVTDKISINSISATASKTNLFVGDNVQINTTIDPVIVSNNKLLFTSSNTSVITVNSNGFVSAIGEGSAIVTISAVDDATKKVTIAFTVTTEPVLNIPNDDYVEDNTNNNVDNNVNDKVDNDVDKPINNTNNSTNINNNSSNTGRCSMCDTYETSKGTSMEIFYKFFHTIIHFFATMFG